MVQVIKFGGSSVSVKGLEHIVNIILNSDDTIIVVLSAIHNLTNSLLNLIDKKIKLDNIFNIVFELLKAYELEFTVEMKVLFSQLEELNDIEEKSVQDKFNILFFGEKMSTLILTTFLKKLSVNHKYIYAPNFIKSNKTSDNIDKYTLSLNGGFSCDCSKLKSLISDECNIYITEGFIASTLDGLNCVLSRGGSDTSASLIAACLNAEKLLICTDVNGFYSSDPRIIPCASIFKTIDYDLAQELAASGSKVMHPYSIIPCKQKNIPIEIHNTFDFDGDFTEIINCSNSLTGVSIQNNISVFNIVSPDMWENYGFVHDIFKVFSKHKVDVNIITTSQFSVHTTTDTISQDKIKLVIDELRKKYTVDTISKCSIVSFITKNVINHTNIIDMFKDKLILSHISSNGLNLSLVVLEDDSKLIAQKLHDYVYPQNITNRIEFSHEDKWWKKHINTLLREKISNPTENLYFYNLNRIAEKCSNLKNKISSVDRIYYAMKANNNSDILKTVYNSGLGFECVSIDEIKKVYKLFNNSYPYTLFTPNFCDISEYQYAIGLINCICVFDNITVLEKFKNTKIGLRLDLDMGKGHCDKVITEGSKVKFGISLSELPEVEQICKKNNLTVIFLHSHKGSGINDPSVWSKTLIKFNDIIKENSFLSTVENVDLGGGLGINVDLDKINEHIKLEKERLNINFGLVLEPGRHIVADSGVVLTKVNQLKTKGNKNFVGLQAGMHTVIRPALYNAVHEIYNISKLESNEYKVYNVVGPMCESGDVLCENVKLPKSDVDDIFLIDTCGAYCHTMSSKYNMREPGKEYPWLF